MFIFLLDTRQRRHTNMNICSKTNMSLMQRRPMKAVRLFLPETPQSPGVEKKQNQTKYQEVP